MYFLAEFAGVEEEKSDEMSPEFKPDFLKPEKVIVAKKKAEKLLRKSTLIETPLLRKKDQSTQVNFG